MRLTQSIKLFNYGKFMNYCNLQVYMVIYIYIYIYRHSKFHEYYNVMSMVCGPPYVRILTKLYA